MSRLRVVTVGCWVALSLAAGCGPGGASTKPGTETSEDGGTADSGTNNNPNNPPPTQGKDGGTDPGTCATVTAEAKEVTKPVDVIMIIDNSCSMVEEIRAVENNINVNFAQIMEKSAIDYRVILISRHGSVDSLRICVRSPLSGNGTCAPVPAEPIHGQRFFHYSTQIESTDSLSVALATWARPAPVSPNGWGAYLRPDAVKNFLEITDDNSRMTAAAFDTALLTQHPEQFGTAQNRNYVFHSIVGLANNTPATKAWLPTDPLIPTALCTRPDGTRGDAVNTGVVYQNLSMLTGGLRYPICGYASFDTVFQQIAKGVADSARVACQFDVPTPPNGFPLGGVSIEYSPGDGSAKQIFKQVPNAENCNATSVYIDNNKVKLCPTACATVTADAKAKMNIAFTCGSVIN